MPRVFDINLNTEPEAILDKAKNMAAKNNFNISGDIDSGTFSGRGVSGFYNIDGRSLSVTVTEKPWYAPWSKVESSITEFFV